jgi:diacylglycerol kinase (ATP)
MTRVRIISNPVASRTNPRDLSAVRGAFEAAGWTAEIVETEHEDHARVLAAEAASDGVDVVAPYGGDGTVVRALDGLIDTGVPVALIPGGTANQLVRNLGLPFSPARAAKLVTRTEARPIDLGAVHAADWTASICVGCGAGFDAELITTASRELKRRLKVGAYIVRGFAVARGLEPTPVRITVDGVVTEMEAVTVLVVNCDRLFPPYRPVRPGIAYDDGVLDVVAVRSRGMLQTLSIMAKLVVGVDDERNIMHLKGREIRVEAESPLPLQRDGEGCGHTPFEVSVRPSAVRIFRA